MLDLGTIAARYGTPLFVYDGDRVAENYRRLTSAFSVYPRHRIYYSLKANPCLALASQFRALGARVDVASTGELLLAEQAGFRDADISLTSACITDVDVARLVRRGIDIVLDDPQQGLRLARGGYRRPVGLRVNPALNLPHLDPCVGAGPDSKFGVPLEAIGGAIDRLRVAGLQVEGIHFHVGSGSLTPEFHVEALRSLTRAMPRGFIPRWINIGGGFGVPYAPWLDRIDLARLAGDVALVLRGVPENTRGEVELRCEPGDFLVADAGHLLTRVWALKSAPDGRPGEPEERRMLICDAGANLLPGASQFGTWYPIEVHPQRSAREIYDVFGPLNQSSDQIARSRELTTARVGDLLCVSMAGAYASARATRFNGRPFPAEVLVLEGEAHLVREPEPVDELWRGHHIPSGLLAATPTAKEPS